jgi:hypothetical protein
MRGRGSGTGRSAEIVSLAERMGYLQGLRAGFVAVAIASALLFPGFVGASLREVALVSVAYFALDVTSTSSRACSSRTASTSRGSCT